MEGIELTKIIITGVVTALCVGIIGGAIGYFWWKLRKTDDYITKDDLPDMSLYLLKSDLPDKILTEEDCQNCTGKLFAESFTSQITTLRREFREDIGKLRDLIIKHITKGPAQ